MAYLYFDLETIPKNLKVNDEDIRKLVPKNYKNIDTINSWIKANRKNAEEKIFKQRSLDPYLNNVICLSYSFQGQMPKAITGSEEYIFKTFQKRINDYLKKTGYPYTSLSLVGHNLKKFDAHILFLRATKYKLSTLKEICFFTRKSFIDTMELASFYIYGQMVSLDTLCTYFNIPTPKETMNGSMVLKTYNRGDLKKIINYCNQDVAALIRIHTILDLHINLKTQKP